MSATLSTLSSGINSSAAAIYEDFLQYKIKNISDSSETLINKFLVLGIGIFSTLLAFCAGPLGGILTVCISVMGAVSGPMVAIFVFAMFWPRAGVKSTFISFVLSNAIMCIVYIFNYFEDPYSELLLPTNTSAEGCGHSNFELFKVPEYEAHFGKPGTSFIARISIYSYAGLGFVLMLVIGVPLIYLFNEQKMKNIDHLTFKGRRLPMPEKSQGFTTFKHLNSSEKQLLDTKVIADAC